MLTQSRLLGILKDHKDAEYYWGAMLFERLAEDKWAVELNAYNVRHGYAHINNVLNSIDKIFDNVADERVLEIVPPKYAFILLSSVYAHDLGMQDYFLDRLPYLKKIGMQTTLTSDDFDDIRHNHADIISDAISKLELGNSMSIFFGDALKKIENFLNIQHPGLFEKVIHLVLNSRRYIAVASSFHNKNLEDFSYQMERLCKEKKICRIDEGFAKLELITAILQFADAIDMSEKRIDKNEFLARVKLIKRANTEMTVPQIFAVKRMFLCYLIDDIIVESNIEHINIRFNMSISTHNKTNHYDLIDDIKKLFTSRLRRGEKDCVAVLENGIGKKINIYMDSESIRSSDDKSIIPDAFFQAIVSPRDQSLQSLLERCLNPIIPLDKRCKIVYVKFYSEIAKVFYGGLAFCGDEQGKKDIERLFVHEEDLDLKEIRKCNSGSNLKKVVKNKDLLRQAKNIPVFKANGIESEIVYIIEYGEKLIGYVNMHFCGKLSSDEIDNLCKYYGEELSDLGLQIVHHHMDSLSGKYIKWIQSFGIIPENLKGVFIDLFKRQYSGGMSKFESTIVAVSIDQLRKDIFGGIPASHDRKSCLFVHAGLFYWLFQTINDKLSDVAKYSLELVHNESDGFVRIELTIYNDRDGDIFSTGLYMKANNYLCLLDDAPHDFLLLKELEYLFPFKSLINLMGGKFVSGMKGGAFMVEAILPKKKYKSFTECSL